jgi:hypothetical protein
LLAANQAENRHDLDALLATFSPSRASDDIPAGVSTRDLSDRRRNPCVV